MHEILLFPTTRPRPPICSLSYTGFSQRPILTTCTYTLASSFLMMTVDSLLSRALMPSSICLPPGYEPLTLLAWSFLSRQVPNSTRVPPPSPSLAKYKSPPSIQLRFSLQDTTPAPIFSSHTNPAISGTLCTLPLPPARKHQCPTAFTRTTT